MNFWDWASTMSIEQVLKIVLAFAKALAWPTVVVALALLFKNPLTALLNRLEAFEGPAGIKSVFSKLVSDTIDVAEQAEVDASEGVDARVAGSEAPARNGQVNPSRADGDREAKETPFESRDVDLQRDSAAWSSFRQGLKSVPGDRAVWSSFLRGLERAQNDPQRLLTVAWHRLEEETERVTSTLKEDADAPRRPKDPVLLFQRLYAMGFVSAETVRGVERASELRKVLALVGMKGKYREEVVGLVAAVDGFTRSLKTIRTTLIGKQAVENVLRNHGDDKLPSA
ncbi:hypothetical protein [Curtobacterium sp. MCSS17_011]|uniref:hypothetical protein n=1 Tax=Curtobacterium sp. MCSS17_011 TaxID=2175643 RepID=UPI0011B682B1|nr:hypothetical protein [Curtobacterium sp. MCSS17_011]